MTAVRITFRGVCTDSSTLTSTCLVVWGFDPHNVDPDAIIIF